MKEKIKELKQLGIIICSEYNEACPVELAAISFVFTPLEAMSVTVLIVQACYNF